MKNAINLQNVAKEDKSIDEKYCDRKRDGRTKRLRAEFSFISKLQKNLVKVSVRNLTRLNFNVFVRNKKIIPWL